MRIMAHAQDLSAPRGNLRRLLSATARATRRAWTLVTDPRAVAEAETDDVTASFMASASRAGLEANREHCVNHPDRPAVTVVEIDGRPIAICAGCLDLAGTEGVAA